MSARPLGMIAALSAVALFLAGCQSDEPGSAASETQEQPAASAGMSVQDLLRAARNGQLARVRRAVTTEGFGAGASDQSGNTPLMLAAYNGHTAVVKFLLDQGAQVDARNGQGRTALMFAATGPFPETVAKLLKRGADPNATDTAEGWSPLMFAAAEGNREVAQHLLEYGADPTRTDRDGETARTFAEKGNHTAVVNLLDSQK